MKVWVCTRELFHDNSTILAVFESEAAACEWKAAQLKDRWRIEYLPELTTKDDALGYRPWFGIHDGAVCFATETQQKVEEAVASLRTHDRDDDFAIKEMEVQRPCEKSPSPSPAASPPISTSSAAH